MKTQSSPKKMLVAGLSTLIIIVAIGILLSQAGVAIGGHDSMAGYYAMQCNPDPNATPDQVSENGVFAFDKILLDDDHTFRMGALKGSWSSHGDTLTLSPANKPEALYPKTSMSKTLSVLIQKPTDFKISSDGKSISAINAPDGPIVMTKVREIFRG